jgi:hypothetical protein
VSRGITKPLSAGIEAPAVHSSAGGQLFTLDGSRGVTKNYDFLTNAKVNLADIGGLKQLAEASIWLLDSIHLNPF